jgi:cysteine desulfurase / selenocysteine lyase
MTDISPEAIAALATRIYNETSAPQGISQATSIPPEPAMRGPIPDSLPHPSPQAATDPLDLSIFRGGAPSIPGGVARPSSHLPTPNPHGNAPEQLPHLVPTPVSGLMSSFSSSPSTLATSPDLLPPPGNSDGLKSFVRNVREIDARSQANSQVPTQPARGLPTRGASDLFSTPKRNIGSEHNDAPRRIRFSEGVSLQTPQAKNNSPLNVTAIRKDFPILRQLIHGRPLAWFDNAATTQKPQSVIDSISHYYENNNSNIHRAAHSLAARSTDAFEEARGKIQRFLGAGSTREIALVRGTTEAINLITNTFGRKFLRSGDEIVLSILEHHANIVPWQMVARETGAVLRVIPVNDRGEIMLGEYERLLGPRTKVVSITHASNSLGTILPVAEMTAMAKRYGAKVLIDGAQTVAHIPVNVKQLGCDFYVFSGHKIFGPTGIGAAFIDEELLDMLPPWQGGGNMIRNVTFEETSYSDAPAKFEAGTPNIADTVGLGAALDYVSQLGLPNIAKYEHGLLEYMTSGLERIPGLRLIGTASQKVGVASFVLPHRRTEEVGKMLDQEGIAVRAGHHCAQPSLRRFGVESTVRPSLAFYNTPEEVDRLINAVRRIAVQI